MMRCISSALAGLLIFLIPNINAIPTLQKRDADFASVRTRLSKAYVDSTDEPSDKYFHESSFHPHYDGRFADRPLGYDEKQFHLTALIQTYLLAMNTLGIETWLMHGTLLGWYWNRKVMPWDSDLDVMVSELSMRYMAHWHNMTEYAFRIPGVGPRKYLLEINPHWHESRLDKSNMIDARWIDTEIGLFIDLTTLRRKVTAEDGNEVMMVKDNHHYLYDDIFPLRKTVFEGVEVRIPFAYADLLVEEYGSAALSGAKHESHRFDEQTQSWVPTSVKLPGKKWEGT